MFWKKGVLANFAKFTEKQACNFINPLTANVPHHTETSQLIYYANQLTGFYMMGTLVLMAEERRSGTDVFMVISRNF